MKLTYPLLLALLLFGLAAPAKTSKAGKSGFKLGVQAYTFHRFTLKQAIDKANELGLKYMEVYYGQPLGEGLEGTMDFNMAPETRKKVLAYAKSKGVKIAASGVVICKDEAEWDALFAFAKDMGIGTITCEPEYKHLKYVDQLANKYKIDVAIHNHPKPSNYWEPDLFLDAVKDLSPRIGACADVGHWKRMGIDPVEALKKYGGRLKMLHFKDVKAKEEGEAEQHDVIWGQGVCNVPGILRELKRQNFNGQLSIEYEFNWDNSVPDIKKCIEFYNQETKKIFR